MRSISLKFLMLTCCAIFFSGCANYKLNYYQDEKNWEQQPSYDESDVAYTLYLLGDAGESPDGGIKPAIKYFNSMLAAADENSAAIILGDNIYFEGMPKKNAGYEREEAEHDLNVQLDGLKSENFKGKSIIIMGNHDWGQDDAIKGVKRQEDYIEDYLNTKEQIVFPEAGCGGPEVIELTDDLVVIAIDSKWWIYDWSKLNEVNDGCRVNSREEFLVYFEDMITDYKGKNIVVALHHPPYSNGPHGGYYSLASHFFPLRQINKNIWLPLPILGTIINATRSSVGTDTDISNPRYKQLKDGIIDIAAKHDSVLFVSGHEHALEYFNIENQHFIVSGSGAKVSPTRANKEGLFTAGKEGFALVKIMNNGAMWSEFYVADEDGNGGKMVYRKKMTSAIPAIAQELEENPSDMKSYPKFNDFTKTSVYNQEGDKNIGNNFLGKFNSEMFYEQVTAPNLDLSTHLGGLEIIQQGGSAQTNSLRLSSKAGKVYVLRSLRKEPVRSLPDELNFELASTLMEHFFTGSNPYAALTLPPLAEAVGISHANPKLFFLPPQEGLGLLNDKYAGQLYMLEERPDETWSGYKDFGGFNEFVSYRKIFREIKKEDDKVVLVDQKEALKNRLFDILIGDFDRHLDNWRFGLVEKEDTFLYVPIPRDRDVAFSNWDGVPYFIGKMMDPFLRATHNYDDKISMIKWLVFQSRGFDDYFLNQLTWSDWKKVTEEMQADLTDEAIQKAMDLFPEEIRAQSEKKIVNALKARRRDLKKICRKILRILE